LQGVRRNPCACCAPPPIDRLQYQEAKPRAK
jgi:hypothetical protein